jgi:hypothetical protein
MRLSLTFIGLLYFVKGIDLSLPLSSRRMAPLSGHCTKVRLMEDEAEVREGVALMIPSLVEANSSPNPRDYLLSLTTRPKQGVLDRLTYILDGVYLPTSALEVLLYANQLAIPSVISIRELKLISAKLDPTNRGLPSLCRLQQWYTVVFHGNGGKSLEEIGVRSVGTRVRYAPSDSQTLTIIDMELSRIGTRYPGQLYKRRRVESSHPEGSVDLLIKGLEEFLDNGHIHN